jgi:hypothetical protein
LPETGNCLKLRDVQSSEVWRLPPSRFGSFLW